jgi:hypothetical protein
MLLIDYIRTKQTQKIKNKSKLKLGTIIILKFKC